MKRPASYGLRLAAVVVCLTSACGDQTGQPQPQAAEPATASNLGAPPAGRVVPIGAQPEGIAVDSATHVVAVGTRDPATLLLLDGGTGSELRRVALPGPVRHLQTQAPSTILVPVEPANELLRVSVPSGQVASRTSTGQSPHDAAATASGTVVVANEGGRSAVVVRGSSVEHTFGGLAQPGGVATFGETAAVIDVGQSTLTFFDTGRRAEIAKVPAGHGPTHVVTDRRGRFVVADTRGNAVLLYETTPTVRQILAVPLDGSPYGIAYDSTRDRLWVTLTARNELVGLDMTATPPAPFARLGAVRQPNSVAVDTGTGRVFVTGTADGVLQIVDP